MIGAPGEHIYPHSFACQEKVCTICGFVCEPTADHMLGDGCICQTCGQECHNYEEGVCTRCGATWSFPEGAIQFNGHTYYRYTTEMTWRNARTYCESNFGHLVTITSDEEQAFLQSNFTGAFWIGVTYEAVEEQRKWITGETLNYSRFSGDPNNFARAGVCAVMRNDRWNNGSWDFADNTVVQAFVCEWDHL